MSETKNTSSSKNSEKNSVSNSIGDHIYYPHQDGTKSKASEDKAPSQGNVRGV